MDPASFKKLSAVESKRLLVAGQASAVALLEASLAVLDESNGTLNAIVDRVSTTELIADAQASDDRYCRGRPRGPIDGLPLTVKDNLWVEGMASTWGALGSHHPVADEPAITRVREAGGLIIGMTNVPPFALAATTSNSVYGVTRHPLDADLTPGGSSGGAAASVAVGVTPFALATDAGGSVRRPAAYTGTVGFKPSTSAVEASVGFPRTAFDFQVIGTLARSVADCALLSSVLAIDSGPGSLGLLSGDTELLLSNWGAASRLRILLVDDPAIVQEEAVSEAMELTAGLLSRAGHHVVREPLPYDVAELDAIWGALIAPGLASAVEVLGVKPDSLPSAMGTLLARGQAMSAVELSRAMQRLLSLRLRARMLWHGADAILSPSAPNFAWPHTDPYPRVIAGVAASPRAAAVYATFANAIGAPAISLPAPSSGSLPVGVQLTCAPGSDGRLLALAWELEKLLAS